MKSVKQEIYLVLVYGIDGQSEIFKAYESKATAQEVVRIKQKESQNDFWTVVPTHLVLSQAIRP